MLADVAEYITVKTIEKLVFWGMQCHITVAQNQRALHLLHIHIILILFNRELIQQNTINNKNHTYMT